MSNKIFDVVQVEQPNRNSFDLTHDYKTTLDMGQLVPVCLMECLPGDRYTLGSQSLVRFAPMIAPTMQRYDARIEYFFVPNRLVWPKFMDFIASDPGNLGAIPAFPTLTISEATYTPLMDYMGIPDPTGTGQSETVNALPFAAYQLIYENYYRDQNLIPANPTGIVCVDGTNNANIIALTRLRRRAWEHDYFTSCLPFAQKGNPVTIGTTSYDDVLVKSQYTGSTYDSISWAAQANPGAVASSAIAALGASDNPDASFPGTLFAETSELDALSVTINDLREAEALQKWLEINARAGTRPNEVIAGHFGVKSSDARLQRPEYIVGVKQTISVSEVLNTTGFIDNEEGEPASAPQGNMSGHAVGMIEDENYGSYFCEEHGFIIGIMSVLPKTSYSQGLNKFWLKTQDPTQYFFPSFAHLGEQPVLTKELWAFNAAGQNVFGYLPAYQDYRYVPSMFTKDFRAGKSLSYWHAGRIFNATPLLGESFISAEPRKDIFAVVDEDVNSLYVHVLNKVFASRLIPVYGTPTL